MTDRKRLAEEAAEYGFRTVQVKPEVILAYEAIREAAHQVDFECALDLPTACGTIERLHDALAAFDRLEEK